MKILTSFASFPPFDQDAEAAELSIANALDSPHIYLPFSRTFLFNSAIIPHPFLHPAFHLLYFPRSPKPQAAVLGLIKFRDNTVFRALFSHRTFSAFILLRFTISIIMNRMKRAPEAMQSGEERRRRHLPKR